MNIDDRAIVTAQWVCHECGMKYGHSPRVLQSTWHNGICDICGEEKAVTEFRDFGYARTEFYSSFPLCTACKGKGYSFFEKDLCPNCNGIGYII